MLVYLLLYSRSNKIKPNNRFSDLVFLMFHYIFQKSKLFIFNVGKLRGILKRRFCGLTKFTKSPSNGENINRKSTKEYVYKVSGLLIVNQRDMCCLVFGEGD